MTFLEERNTMDKMLVKCTVCGREEHPNASGSLRTGWPTCCGYTMRLESTKEFIAAVEAGAATKAIGDARAL